MKKIIFWLDKELSRFGIAKEIKDSFDCELFSIIDTTNKPKEFFENQKIIKFEKKWFYHDNIKKTNSNIDTNYLKTFEKKYGIDLWLLASNERIFFLFNEFYKFQEEEVLKILEQECKLFESILDEVKPDCVSLPTPALHHCYLFYLICKARNIPTVILQMTRIANRCIISNKMESIGYEGQRTSKKRSLEELLQFRNQSNIYNQSEKFRSRFQSSKNGLLKSALKFLTSENSNMKTHYTYYGRTKSKVLTNYIKNSLKAKIRKSYIDNNLLKEINFKKPFIFFPLHVEQEHSLLNVAPFYINQIEVIKNIAKALPIGYDLVVKEHPTMFAREWRKISDYKILKSIPNVKLLHPSVPPTNILKKCSMVITISGTAAFEIGFYKKPAIIFSDTAFTELSWIKRLQSFENLSQTIKKLLDSKMDFDDLNDYIDYIDKNTFEHDHNNFAQDSQDFFHYGGFLVDVKISENNMNNFLKLHKSTLQKVAFEHIKKFKEVC